MAAVTGRSTRSLDRFRTVDLVETVYAAFSEAPRPSADEITHHRCPECDDVRDLLHPFTAREVPDLEQYPLYSALSLLTAPAYRYYLPRYIANAVQTPSSNAAEMLLYSLGRTSDDRVAGFSPRERVAVLEFVDHLEKLVTVDSDRYYIDEARKLWK